MSVSAPAFNAVARMAAIQSRFDQMANTVSSAGTAPAGPAAPLDASLLTGLSGATSPDFSSVLQSVTSGDHLMAADGAGSPTSQQIVDVANEYLGIPYVWGGTNPETGLDCSGFVQNVFARFGVDLPRVSRDQARAGEPVASIGEARPGDVIAFGEPVDHIGIYVGDNKIIHAPRTGEVVKVSTIYRKPTAIRRLVPTFPTSQTSVASLGQFDSANATGVGRYSALFAQAGAKWGISPKILAAVAQAESGGNPNAVSRSGALGLMQFMPTTARSFGIDPLDPAQAVDAAAKYLSQQVSSFGSIELALASYNAGPGAVRKFGGIPPYAETQAYVRKIMTQIGESR